MWKRKPEMSRSTRWMSPELRKYMLSVSVRETGVLEELRKETGKMSNAGMQISPEQGQFLHFLVRTIEAARALEVGVFTGYSALWTALALPEDGTVTACDISSEWTSVARTFWKKAGILHKIDLRLGPASETLGRLLDSGRGGTYDFAFIDADKEGYGDYYEKSLALLRSGGVMALDNVFRNGRVTDRNEADPGTEEIRELNRRISVDERVDISMIPIGDGLTLVRKR